ncbi:MAG: hypothetical protein IV090_21555 [Candidatus Sericytochromatia bacterium]|nr:hypothetical protein [Candidatus Sericytochromatia bacterium]
MVDDSWKKNKSIKIKVVEGGDAGIILRKNQNTINENQSTHIKNNDINIFNPTISGSLGDLKPYQGDLSLNDGTFISAAKINNSEELFRFQSGVLIRPVAMG